VAPRVGGLALFLLCTADGFAFEDTVLSIVLEAVVDIVWGPVLEGLINGTVQVVLKLLVTLVFPELTEVMKSLRRQRRRNAIARNATSAVVVDNATAAATEHVSDEVGGAAASMTVPASMTTLAMVTTATVADKVDDEVAANDGDAHDAHDDDSHNGMDAHDGDDGDNSTVKGKTTRSTASNPAHHPLSSGSYPMELVGRIDAIEEKLKPLLEPPRKRLARTNARVHEVYMLVAALDRQVRNAVKQWKSNRRLDDDDIQEMQEKGKCLTEEVNNLRNEMNTELDTKVNTEKVDEILATIRHDVTAVETNLEESKVKITSDTDQAVNALNGRIDVTNKDLDATLASLHTTRNSLSDCFDEVAVVRSDLEGR